MDDVPPGELLQAALTAASKKAELSVPDMLIRGFLAGAILAYAASLACIDLRSGTVLNHPEGSACLSTFPVRIEEGVVCVQRPLEEPAAVSKSNSCEHRDRPVRWVLRKPSAPAKVRSSAH
jgi:hypothetical protein